ncbi:MAG: acetate/propionate family kinase [Rhodospirillaceae bacterium]
MTQALLTLNAGSSSLKFAIYQRASEAVQEMAVGQIEGLGVVPKFRVKAEALRIRDEITWEADVAPKTHGEALQHILGWCDKTFPGTTIDAVGHRIVHGGPSFSEPVILDAAILEKLGRYEILAPLHQPHNLAGVRAAQEAFPQAVQVGCFDTAFHRAHPWVNDTFALPRQYYDEGVRRYGFHGLSYEYVSNELRRIAPMHARGRCVVAHLGNGASMCAIQDGQSVGSTMGFSALDGLPMGTRTGQIDPGVLLYLMDEHGMGVKELTALLYKESGLKGLSGVSSDLREIEASPSPEAAQAIDYFVFRIRRELGAMLTVLGGIDALVFCGGIGENAIQVRQRICEGMDWLGIELDHHRNRNSETVISSDRSRARVFVIKTDEEAMIATHTERLLRTTDQAAAAQ